jgi:hypothetical protein
LEEEMKLSVKKFMAENGEWAFCVGLIMLIVGLAGMGITNHENQLLKKKVIRLMVARDLSGCQFTEAGEVTGLLVKRVEYDSSGTTDVTEVWTRSNNRPDIQLCEITKARRTDKGISEQKYFVKADGEKELAYSIIR